MCKLARQEAVCAAFSNLLTVPHDTCKTTRKPRVVTYETIWRNVVVGCQTKRLIVSGLFFVWLSFKRVSLNVLPNIRFCKVCESVLVGSLKIRVGLLITILNGPGNDWTSVSPLALPLP